MFANMEKIGIDKLERAIKRKRSNDDPEARKKKPGEVSIPSSSERTPLVENNRTFELMVTKPTPPTSLPTMSSDAVLLSSPEDLGPSGVSQVANVKSAQGECIVLYKEQPTTNSTWHNLKLAEKLLGMILLLADWRE